MAQIPGRWLVTDQPAARAAPSRQASADYLRREEAVVNSAARSTAVTARSASPRPHVHVHIHDRRDQQREDPDAVAGLEPANRTMVRRQPDPEMFTDCAVRAGDKFTVAGTARDGSGFVMRRDTGARDEGGQSLLQQPEFGMGWPADPDALENAFGGEQFQMAAEPDRRRGRSADEARFAAMGRERLGNLQRDGRPDNEMAGIAEFQRRLNEHYSGRKQER